MSEPIPYPAWRYGPEGLTVVVLSEAEDDMLDESWADLPPEGFVFPKIASYTSVYLIEKANPEDEGVPEVKRRGRPRKIPSEAPIEVPAAPEGE